jgi:AcrR family transcriptional regulator
MAKPLRRAILDTALALVDSGGIDALSIREVARRAKVTHQAPYHHFKDRAAILAAIAIEGFSLLREEMVAARDAAPANRRVMACGVGYFRFAVAHRAHFRIMFRSESYSPRHAELRSASIAALQILIECVVAAQAARLAPSGDPTALVVTLWSAAHGLASLWVDGAMSRAFVGAGRDADIVGELVGRTLTDLLEAAAKQQPRAVVRKRGARAR